MLACLLVATVDAYLSDDLEDGRIGLVKVGREQLWEH